MAKARTQARPKATLVLPPIYAQVPVGEGADAFAAACGQARAGGSEGAFVWSASEDVVDCAIVLAPERPLAEARLAIHVAMVGIGDALGALVPPAVEVGFGWPDEIHINGAFAGGCRFAADAVEDGAEPDWAAVGLSLRVAPEDGNEDPGDRPDTTSLFDEGCGDLTATMVLESFARHFLYWINRWQDDGFGAVQSSWLARALGRDMPSIFESQTVSAEGKVFAIDKDGGLMIKPETGRMVTLPLAPALVTPAWETP